ncbi:alkaline-phosphatase-like protein [Zopfochytrium polystomum]|nr:alkaline-phosphatase-like protein [Zopfochytrium polystomum]
MATTHNDAEGGFMASTSYPPAAPAAAAPRWRSSRKDHPTGIRTTITRRHLYIAIGVTLGVIVVIALAVGFTVGRRSSSSSSAPSVPVTILICLDGFKPSYLANAPSIKAFFDSAAQAARLQPLFPAQSFPNQYAMVTGLYPADNGIVGDYFHSTEPIENSAAVYSFGRNDTVTVNNASFWLGTPVWITAQAKGLEGATVNWPGSEASIQNTNPSLELPFTKTLNDSTRINTLLKWLASKDASGNLIPNPPSIMMTHLRAMDVAGVSQGGDVTNQYIAGNLTNLDNLFKNFMAGLNDLGVANSVNLIVLSDHGIATVDKTKTYYYEDLFADTNQAIIVQNRPMAYVYPKDGVTVDSLASKLKTSSNLPMTFFIDGDSNYPFPATFQRSSNPRRIPPIVILPNEGVTLAFRNTSIPTWPNTGGSAGYLNTLDSMAGIFAARGPGFKYPTVAKNLVVNPVDVYALICNLLSITPAAGTVGSLTPFRDAGILA